MSSSGNVGQQCELGLQHFEFDDHVAEQLALGGVGERTVVGELVNFSDVVQECAGEQQVAIDLRIVAAHQVAGAEQRDDVIEQAADVGVMQSLGGGSVAVGGGDFRVGHEGLHERPEMRILECGDEIGERLPEFVDVFGGLGKVVGEVDFGFAQLAQFVDGELKTVFVFVDEAFDLEEVVLLEGVENFFDVIPHFGFELAAAVAESEGEVRLSGFLGLDLLADDDEARGDDLVLVAGAIADVEIFHGSILPGNGPC